MADINITREASIEATKGFREMKAKKYGPFAFSYAESNAGVRVWAFNISLIKGFISFQYCRK